MTTDREALALIEGMARSILQTPPELFDASGRRVLRLIQQAASEQLASGDQS